MKSFLGDLVDIVGGGTPSKGNPEFWGGNIPWASVKDFKSTELANTADYITDLGVKNSATNVIPAGNIIVPTRMALGKVAINKVHMAINQDLKALLIKDEKVLSKKYLLRFLESKAGYIEEQGKGATVKGITLDVLRGIEIPLPPLAEQKRIAAILDKADAIRRKRQQAIQLADEFLRAVFLDMFGDPNSQKIAWDVCCLGSFGGNVDNRRIPLKESDRSNRQGKYPYFGATGIIDHIDDFIFDGDHLLIAEDGKNLVNRNKPLAFPASGQFWVNNHAHVIQDTGTINLIFLEYYLNLKDISNFVTGIDQFKLNRSSLDTIPVLNPPMHLQKNFDSIVKLTRKNNLIRDESDIGMRDIFNSLSQKAFSGQL